jgi:hypothetical protein
VFEQVISMKFAKIVFWIAGIFGVLFITPLYFMLDTIGRQTPPAITHPQFYYGFIGVALVWQFVYLTVATNPVRFRPMMILSAMAKGSFALTVGVLTLQGRMTPVEWVPALPDAILMVLFIIAFFKTPPGGPDAGPKAPPFPTGSVQSRA